MISIVIPWRNRSEIYRSSEYFVTVADALGAEIVLVNYGGDLNRARLPQSTCLRIIEVEKKRYFNKASTNNIGAAYARFPLLFFCDCDILPTEDVVKSCSELLQATDTFVTVAHAQEETINAIGVNHIRCFGYHMTIKTRDNRQVDIIDSEEDATTGLRNAPGLLFVKADDFKAINGYGGYLQGWGWEDQDMICRLTLGLGLKREQYGTLMHLSHDDHSRTAEYPPADNRWESRDRMFRTALSRYDQNLFLGTYQEDLQTHQCNEPLADA